MELKLRMLMTELVVVGYYLGRFKHASTVPVADSRGQGSARYNSAPRIARHFHLPYAPMQTWMVYIRESVEQQYKERIEGKIHPARCQLWSTAEISNDSAMERNYPGKHVMARPYGLPTFLSILLYTGAKRGFYHTYNRLLVGCSFF